MLGLKPSETQKMLYESIFTLVWKTERLGPRDKRHPPQQTKCRSVWDSKQTETGVGVLTAAKCTNMRIIFGIVEHIGESTVGVLHCFECVQ